MRKPATAIALAIAIAASFVTASSANEAKTVKVFILAGQSNMEGKAPNSLLDYQAEDPKTKDLFTHLRKDGKWIVRDDVFIKYLDRKGPLTIGYGSPGRTGVELEFGTMMGDHFHSPVLLIKAAWGGHSLVKLFRSPSAGYPTDAALHQELKEAQDRVKKNNAKEKKNDPLPTMDDITKAYGSSYRNMLAEVKETFDNYQTMFPALKGKKLELAGFAWFQGWNDQYGGAEKEYASNMMHFIKDVRKDLAAPNLPFVIAAMGQNGSQPAAGAMLTVREAQMSMNEVPEFKGNVKAFRTDVLVDKEAEALYPTWNKNAEQWKKTGGDHGYHYLGSAIWFNRIGKAMGEAMLELIQSASSTAPKGVLPGVVKSCSFSNSAIFPGTVRDVSVFIPAQYDGSKPACVYVKTDGYNPREKTLLETLIAGKAMPVTIGVFVRPGDLPATVKNTMGRRNRCFEYDGMGDNNVRFLVEELLPFVAKKFDLKLSTSGNDRCIAGGSSGGITAFNAVWQRPDAFSRVYANSGSFVAFRGGHEFPTLVRKFEAKPIRAYLTTGTMDMENCAGDWFLLDQEMDKALRFSGYDYFFRVIKGGHVAGYYDFFPEAMSFIWKDWPQPVQAGPSAPRVRDIILPDEKWQMLAQGLRDARGPACNAGGEVFFADPPDNKICRIDLAGNVKVFSPDAGQASGLSFGPEGQLYAVSSITGKIMSYDLSGKGTLVVDGLRGHYILAMPGGGLYVTSSGEKPGNSGTVWFVKDGKKTLVDAGLKFATGLAYRPDQWLLSVADGHSKWAYSYQINADGTLANKERFFWLHVPDWEDDAGGESVCYAKEGQMFVATRWGIQVCADDGPTQVILPMPDRSRVIGVCLGGRDMDTLFAFCGDKIWKRKVKVHALGAFTPRLTVKATSL